MNNDIRPLKDIVDISGGFPVLVAVILILAALTVAALIYFRKKREKEEKPALPPKPAEEIARDALKTLKEMRLIE
jgi:hypothetical protein